MRVRPMPQPGGDTRAVRAAARTAALALVLSAAGPGLDVPLARAEGVRAPGPTSHAYPDRSGRLGYGYAGAFVRGDYVGAPFTRVPSPNRIVPTPWSYGTYGVPTFSGLPAAPVAAPTLTVIDGRGSGSARSVSVGARVIEVQVPRR